MLQGTANQINNTNIKTSTIQIKNNQQNQQNSNIVQSFNSNQSNFISTIISNKKNYGSIQQNYYQQIYQWEASYIQGKFYLTDKQTIDRYYQIEQLMTIEKKKLKQIQQKQKEQQQNQKLQNQNDSPKNIEHSHNQIIDSGMSEHSRILYQTIKSISEIHKKQDLQQSLMSEGQKNSYLLNNNKINTEKQPFKNNQESQNTIQNKNKQHEQNNKYQQNQQQVKETDSHDNINQNAYIIGANGRKVYLKTIQKQQSKNMSFAKAMTQLDVQKLQERAKRAKQTLEKQEQAYNSKIKQSITLKNQKNNSVLQNKVQVQKNKMLSNNKSSLNSIDLEPQKILTESQNESQEESFTDLNINRQPQILCQQNKIIQLNNPQNVMFLNTGKLKTIPERINTDKSAQWSSINSNLVKNSQKQFSSNKKQQVANKKSEVKRIIMYQTDRQFLTSNQFMPSDLQIHSRKKSNPQFISQSKISVLSQSKRKSGFIRTAKIPAQSIINTHALTKFKLKNQPFNEQSLSIRSKTKSHVDIEMLSQSQKSSNRNQSFNIKKRSLQKKNFRFQQYQNLHENNKQIISNLTAQKASIESKQSGYLKKKLNVNIQKITKQKLNKNDQNLQTNLSPYQQQQNSNMAITKSQLTFPKNHKEHLLITENKSNFIKSKYLGKILQLSPNKTNQKQFQKQSEALESRIHDLEDIVSILMTKLNLKATSNKEGSKNKSLNENQREYKQKLVDKINNPQIATNTNQQLSMDEVLNLDSLKKTQLIDQIKRLKKSIRALQLQKIKSMTINSQRDNKSQNYKQTTIQKIKKQKIQDQIKKVKTKSDVKQQLLQVLSKAKPSNQVKKNTPNLHFIGPFSEFKDANQQNFIQKIQVPQLPQPPTYQMSQQQLFQLSIQLYKLFGVQYDQTPYTLKDANKRSKLLVKKYKNCVFFDIVGKEKTIVWNLKQKQSKFYIGGWQSNNNPSKGTKNGDGLQITNTYIYQGQFQKGKKHGKGKAQYRDGSIYQGQFIQNYKNGLGRQFNASNKQFYIGQFKNNQRDGSGSLKMADKGYYKGLFSKNLKQGYGHQVFQNGDQYKGQYLNNLIHGKGTYFWKNGSSYEGQFQNGKRHGYGKWISAKISDGQQRDTYVGLYKNDRKQGQGKYTWKNGYFYQGQFLNDLKHGKGTLVYENRILQGTWKNGQLINNNFGFTKKQFQDQFTLYQGQYQGIY